MKRAPKYTILLQRRDRYGGKSTPTSMSPNILSDISARDLGQVWDRLAITANCCQYTVRLDSMRLSRHESSISLSMLGLYLMNEELLSNHPRDAIDSEKARLLSVEDFIDRQSYKAYPPFLVRSSLTFNKGCRLFGTEITRVGMQATGYMWQIRRILPTARLRDELPREPKSRNELDPRVRRRLRQLAELLYDNKESFLAQRLDRLLLKDEIVGSKRTFAAEWMEHMAECLVTAMDQGKALYIAQLASDKEDQAPSSGSCMEMVKDTVEYNQGELAGSLISARNVEWFVELYS